jgi:hypothetical protein
MAVYEGVLERLAEGDEISSEGTGGYFTHRLGITRWHRTGVDPQAGMVQRQFADVSGTRLRNLILPRYYDDLLEEALGEEVALSVIGPAAPDNPGRHTVVAVRTPRAGLERPSGKRLLAGSIWLVLKHWITAPIVFLILLIPAWMASVIWMPLGWVGLLGAVALSLWWMIVPFPSIRRTVRAAGALDDLPSTYLTRVARSAR